MVEFTPNGDYVGFDVYGYGYKRVTMKRWYKLVRESSNQRDLQMLFLKAVRVTK